MKRFVMRWAVLFIAANLFGFVVHGLLLQGDYAASPQLLRRQQDANRHFVYMLIGFALNMLIFHSSWPQLAVNLQ
jgi:hypothetical protein